MVGWVRGGECGIKHNSFEDNDTSLDDFPYMCGYVPDEKDDRVMIYQWDEDEGKNKRVWVKIDNL